MGEGFLKAIFGGKLRALVLLDVPQNYGYTVSLIMNNWVPGVLLLSLLLVSSTGKAASLSSPSSQEPSYCDPALFDEKEMDLGDFEKLKADGIQRAHGFKLGQVTLIGLGVGDSKTSSVVHLAQKYSEHLTQEKRYCTWYLNHPKGLIPREDQYRITSAKMFNHLDVNKNPMSLNEKEATEEFMKVLEKAFDTHANSFLNCATDQHYIALGCNGMRHRGPTVFGMLLAFSGCSPEHALEISNQVWGLNGVKRKVRLAVIRKAYELGQSRSNSRKKLAQLFSGE